MALRRTSCTAGSGNYFIDITSIVYDKNWNIRSPELWRNNLIKNALSEVVVMAIGSVVFSLTMFYTGHILLLPGSFYGVYLTLKNMALVLYRILTGEQSPTARSASYPHEYQSPPSSSFRVDQVWHHPHHHAYPNHGYSSVVRIFDPIFGTARSFARKSIAILNLTDLSGALTSEFVKQKSKQVHLLTDHSKVNIEDYDVLIVDAHEDCTAIVESFFDSINGNDDIANKELFLVIQNRELSVDIEKIENNAPIIVRKIYLSSIIKKKDVDREDHSIFAVRDFRTIVA